MLDGCRQDDYRQNVPPGVASNQVKAPRVGRWSRLARDSFERWWWLGLLAYTPLLLGALAAASYGWIPTWGVLLALIPMALFFVFVVGLAAIVAVVFAGGLVVMASMLVVHLLGLDARTRTSDSPRSEA
jgi:hypothetical protein